MAFSEQVKVSLDIVDSNGAEVKSIYSSPAVTNPDAKVWDGTNTAGTVVPNGTYTIKIVFVDSNGNSVTDTSKTIKVNVPFNENTAITSSTYSVGSLIDIYGTIGEVFLATPKSVFLNNITFEAGALENTASSSLSDPIQNGDTLVVSTPNGGRDLIYKVAVDPVNWSEGTANSITAGDFVFDTSNFMPAEAESNDYRCNYDFYIYQNVFPARQNVIDDGFAGPCSAAYPTYEWNISFLGIKTSGEYDFYINDCVGFPCQSQQKGDYYRMYFDGTNWSAISPTPPPTDITPPTVLSFYPSNNSVDVPIDVQSTLTFSEPLDPKTVNSDNIQLREYATSASDAKEVPAALTTSQGGTVVGFYLSSPLQYSKQYYFFVGSGVQDIAGNSFAKNTWYHAQRDSHEFTTMSLIDTTSPSDN